MGGRLSLESRFPSFEEAIDVADEMRQRRHARGKTLAMRAIAALLIVAAICIGGFPAMLQYRSARDLSGTSVRSAQTVAGWPYPQADDAFAAAQDYNKRLAESGQPILGEAKDPFADVRGGSRASCPILVNRTIRVVRVQARTPVPQAPVRRTRSTGVCWIPAVA